MECGKGVKEWKPSCDWHCSGAQAEHRFGRATLHKVQDTRDDALEVLVSQ